jgi:hypothetical protein
MDYKIWSHLVFASRPTSFRDLRNMVTSVRNCVVTKSECEWTISSRSHSRGEGNGTKVGVDGKQEVRIGFEEVD